MPYLRQSTSQTVRFGQFVDSTDGATAETALTIAQADMQLSKDGGAFAQKNAAGNATHDTDGWYSTTLNATDTNTVGELILQVNVTGALYVTRTWWVIEESIYDALFGASASGFDANQRVDVAAVGGTAQTANDNGADINTLLTRIIGTLAAGTHNAQSGDAFARLGAPVGASISADISTVDTVVDGIQSDLDNGTDGLGAIKAETASIVADTNELQTDWANGGRLDLILDGRASQASVDTVDSNVDAILVDTGTTLETHLTDIKGATFNGSTDSLEALRDRGDSAWTTGAGGTPPQLLQNTTIATLASQTSFTLTAGSADNDAYNDAIAIVTDQTTSTQKAVGTVSDYVGSTRTVTLSADPGIFTMAVGDTIDIIAPLGSSSGSGPSAAAIADAVWDEAQADHTTAGTFGETATEIANIEADTNELQGDWANGGRLDNILDATATQTSVNGLNNLSAADVNAEVDAALSDIHLDHLLATNYDPASKPGVATALLNEIIESDAGVSRFTANALENAPSSGGGSSDWTSTEREQIRFRLGLDGTQTNPTTNTGTIEDILADTNELQTDDVPGLIAALNDPTVAAIADAVWDELQSAHTTSGSFGEIATEIASILQDTATTIPNLISALNDVSSSDVLTQVNSALDDTISELGAGAPAATPTIRTALMLLYMMARNRVDITNTAKEVHNNAGSVIATKSLSDDGTTYSEAEMS